MKRTVKDEKEAKKMLKAIIGGYIENYVRDPTFETIEKDLPAIDKIGNALVMLQVSSRAIFKKGSKFNEEATMCLSKEQYLDITDKLINMVGSEGERNREEDIKELGKITWQLCTRRCLLNYLHRLLHSIAVSILSASYICSMILLRSAFELLIGIATRKEGSMADRISSVRFLSSSEKRKLKHLWKELCGWTHPYKKWIRKTCPTFIAFKPIHHPTLCKKCISKLENITDLLLLVTVEKFKVSRRYLKSKAKKSKVDLSSYPMISKRL